ncbi:hypothetical protein BC332_30334 [Capsicum chinense]|nr:hypothetical protein BC332_30334 [Capsicum chinense]
MNGYAKTGFLSYARRGFDVMPLRDTSSWNTFLSMYSKQGAINKAHSIFNEMHYRDSVSWTTMIAGYKYVFRFDVSIRMFIEMVGAGVLPTQYTFTSVLASCAEIRALYMGVCKN